MADQWVPLTSEQLRKLRHHPTIVAKITELANRLCANANSIDPSPANQKAKAPNFAVVVQNHPDTQRPRAYVRPVGKTGLHVEAGHAVLLKAIATMGGQADTTGTPAHPQVAGHVFQGIGREPQ